MLRRMVTLLTDFILAHALAVGGLGIFLCLVLILRLALQ
jgi:hypothetical protein